MTKRSKAWSLVIVICLLSTPIVKAVQIERVTNNNNDGPGSLRQAIKDVLPGGQVLFDPQVEGSVITLTTGAISISKSLSIVNNRENRVTVSAQGNSQVFLIANNLRVLIRGINISDGYVASSSSDIRSRGGGIFSDGQLHLEYCSIENSKAAFGGGIWADSLRLSHCSISHNTSYKDGGGIHVQVLSCKYSTISENEAMGREEKMRGGYVYSLGSAGGILVEKYLDIAQSTIARNNAGLYGGGIYMPNGNSLLSMYNCTISENSAQEGGGLNTEATMELFANNIAANNKASLSNAVDINSTIMSNNASLVQNNLIGIWGGEKAFIGIDNVTGTTSEPIDPMLGPLSNNGGDTYTYSLDECAPIIDKGVTLSNTDTDQRGLPRTRGLTTDIGSVEYQKPESRMCQTFTCDSLVVNAGIDKGVLYSTRGFFRRYSCIDLSANASGGLAPYSFSWSSDIDQSITNSADIRTCPTQDVTYTLTVTDANGCIATDDVTISAYSFRDARRITNCGSSAFRVLVCSPYNNTSRCAYIYSNSNLNGLGPLLNAGFYPGPCPNIVSDQDNLKNQIQFIKKVWPIPSRGTINFTIRKSNFSNITFQLFDEEKTLVRDTTIDSSNGKTEHHTEQIKGLSKGHYTYTTLIAGVITDKGAFYVE